MLNIIIIVSVGFILSIVWDYLHFNYLKNVKKDEAMKNVEYGFNWLEKYYDNK